MKTIIHVLTVILVSLFLGDSPRIVEDRISVSKGETVDLDFDFADEINIKTWNKDEVFVKVSVNINDNEDNDAFELLSGKSGSGVKITSEIKNMEDLHKESYTIKKDEDGDYYINNCNLSLELFFEVFIPEDVKLNIHTISGDIIITGFENEMHINTISGFIDLSLNARKKAEIEMSTISGEAFTNLDLKFPEYESGMHHVCGQVIDATLNGGGTAINLETISGNIYLRKAN